MSSTIIRGAEIVSDGERRKGTVVISNGIIERISFSTGEMLHADTEVDANGMLLLPGVIDEHVHFRDPGYTQKADTASESRAAAAGGVTSYMDMPNTNPPTTSIETLEQKYALGATESRINYSYYFGATNNNAHLLERLDRRNVCGVKLFMGASTGNMLVDDEKSLASIFDGTDLLIAAHCEDSKRIAENTRAFKEKYGDDVPIRFHPQIRDEEACYRSSAHAAELADKYGARLHILHISTARELSLFDCRPLDEKKITAEACLAHLLFDESDYETLGARIKCNPSVKTSADREALRQAIASGRIDTVATDHAPHLLKEKEGGATRSVSGMPMVQFSLITMLDMAAKGEIPSVETVVEKMCHAPACLYHIEKRGYIREGYAADLALVSREKWTLTKEDILSKCGWSPLEGHTFGHRVRKTFVNGHIVYDDGRIDDNIRGQRLLFDY